MSDCNSMSPGSGNLVPIVQTNGDTNKSMEELFNVVRQPRNESCWKSRNMPQSFYNEPTSYDSQSPGGNAVKNTRHQSPKRTAAGLQVNF